MAGSGADIKVEPELKINCRLRNTDFILVLELKPRVELEPPKWDDPEPPNWAAIYSAFKDTVTNPISDKLHNW